MTTSNPTGFKQRLHHLAPLTLNPHAILPAGTRLETVPHLLDAANVVDEIFWRQVMPPHLDRGALLAQLGDDADLREGFFFHYGPYDRLADDEPFLPVPPKSPGAGFYPGDLTRDEFTAYVERHPESRSALESPYTIVRRDGARLTAVPYHEAYRDLVEPLSRLLQKASDVTEHLLLRDFLAARARDVLSDDYIRSETLWVGLRDSPIEVVIGPYEVYEDQLMGLKASYEALIIARDFEESKKVSHFQTDLPTLAQSLENELGRSLDVEDRGIDLSVGNLAYATGDGRKGIPSIALTLPNDERVIEDVGSRQVILKNILEAKFRLVAWPMLSRLLQEPLRDEDMALRNFVDHTLLHEIAHSIGPQRITVDGEPTTVNRRLRQHFSILEEAKADVVGACLVLRFSEGVDTRSFVMSYLAGLVRPTRFGLTQAHGGANALQFNYLREAGALRVATDTMVIDHRRAQDSLATLARTILDIQERGDFDAAQRLVKTHCVMSPQLEALIQKTDAIPIDIRIRYTNS